MGKNFTVDFVGVGTSRSGTTWIAKCLQEHPEICTPTWKEVHFFDHDHNYKRGLGFYKTFFKNYEDKITGEFCPEYIFEEKALKRIKEDYPDTKILISLRNPIERAFSHFLYVKRKNVGIKDFGELFTEDRRHIIEQSAYYKYLQNIYKYFDKEKVLIVIHDDHKKDAEAFIQNIYSFLGVNNTFVPGSLLREINKSKNLNFKFNWFEKLFSGRLRKKKYFFWRVLIKLLKSFKIADLLNYLRNANSAGDTKEEKEVLLESYKKKLWELYKCDIEKLEILLGRSLNDWKYE